MRPLLVRRAGQFEKTIFDLSIAVGVAGLFPQSSISTAITSVFSFALWWFWVLLIVSGIGGRVVTWRSNHERTIVDIQNECQAEGIVLTVMSMTWLVYTLGNIALLADGKSATIPLLFSLSIVLASARRGVQIWWDLRKIKKALRAPESVSLPPLLLGDPDDDGTDL